MRFASMRNLDISNGEGVGVSLFVQGCDRHCFNCFNPDTWNFNGGKEWTEEIKDKFMKLIDRPYIKRVSFLGGECLAEQNLDEVLKLIQEIRISFPEKTIWLYTGYTWEQLVYSRMPSGVGKEKEFLNWNRRNEIISNIDICIDGEYVDNLKDLTLKWRGSKNQRVIDVKQSLAQNKVVLYCD